MDTVLADAMPSVSRDKPRAGGRTSAGPKARGGGVRRAARARPGALSTRETKHGDEERRSRLRPTEGKGAEDDAEAEADASPMLLLPVSVAVCLLTLRHAPELMAAGGSDVC